MTVNTQGLVRKSLLIIAVAATLLWAVVRTKVLAAKLTVRWSYDYAPEPVCSPSRTTNCIDHFEIGDLTDQRSFVLIEEVPNPSAVLGKVDDISVTFKYGPPFGQRTISVIAVGKDAKGDRITSNPFAARASVMIMPGSKSAAVF